MGAGLNKALLAMLLFMIVFLTILVSYQVLARYVDAIPPALWTEEASRFLLIWMIMLGSVSAVCDNTHFRVEFFPTKKGSTWYIVSETINYLIILVFALAFGYEGLNFAQIGMVTTAPVSKLPLIVINLSFPLAAFGWIFFATMRYIDTVISHRNPEDGD